MYKINKLTVIDKNTQKPLAKPKRSRIVSDIERYRELEKKRYETLLEVDVEIDLCYSELTKINEQ